MVRRFYCSEDGMDPGDTCRMPLYESHHMKEVLRMKKGDPIEVFDKKGRVYKCTITGFDKKQVLITIDEVTEFVQADAKRVLLAYAMPKAKKIDLVIQKATELGIAEIFLFISERSVVTLDEEKKKTRFERWNRIAVEAVKQCCRSDVPVIHEVTDIEQICLHEPNQTTLFVAEREGADIRDVTDIADNKRNVMIVVGPEGGFSENEMVMLTKMKAISVKLGKNVLRTETAAITAVAVMKILLSG